MAESSAVAVAEAAPCSRQFLPDRHNPLPPPAAIRPPNPPRKKRRTNRRVTSLKKGSTMLILTCSLLSACLVAQTPAVPKEGENAALRAELHSMVEKDQEARMKLIEWMKKSGQTDAPSLKEKEDVPEVKRLQELDKKHT